MNPPLRHLAVHSFFKAVEVWVNYTLSTRPLQSAAGCVLRWFDVTGSWAVWAGRKWKRI